MSPSDNRVSVRRTSDGGDVQFHDAYDEMEVQRVGGTMFVGSGDLTGGNQVFAGDPVASFDPAGGLEYGELAELVYAEIEEMNIAYSYSDSNDQSDPGAVEWALALQTQPSFVQGSDAAADAADTDFNSLNAKTHDHGDRLLRGQTVQSNSFADETNGPGGGGGGGGPSRWEYDFRDVAGRGPMFDHQDELHVTTQANTDGLSSLPFGLSYTFHFIWDVVEVEQRDLKAAVYSDD